VGVGIGGNGGAVLTMAGVVGVVFAIRETVGVAVFGNAAGGNAGIGSDAAMKLGDDEAATDAMLGGSVFTTDETDADVRCSASLGAGGGDGWTAPEAPANAAPEHAIASWSANVAVKMRGPRPYGLACLLFPFILPPSAFILRPVRLAQQMAAHQIERYVRCVRPVLIPIAQKALCNDD